MFNKITELKLLEIKYSFWNFLNSKNLVFYLKCQVECIVKNLSSVTQQQVLLVNSVTHTFLKSIFGV